MLLASRFPAGGMKQIKESHRGGDRTIKCIVQITASEMHTHAHNLLIP